jgi:pilus assembly protein Flp/PilA
VKTSKTLCFFNQINCRAIRNHLVKVELLDHSLGPLRLPSVDPRDCAMKNLLVRFVKDKTAATAIEYGLIAAGISVAIIAVVNDVGSSLNGKFSAVSTQLK